MAALHDIVQRVARSMINVLVLGETGVGKERMAEAVHRASPRADRPFICLNCAVLSESLLESELFGHEKGAFTSAVGSKPGLFEAADGGTVFLDEVGELTPGLQVKLLRVLEDRKIQRVGSIRPRVVDVRFVSATNRDLRAEIAAGRFRDDLYYRLDGICIRIPPLRERMPEIRPLAREFVRDFARRGAQLPEISERAFALLEAHPWPGNIRELRNVIERGVLLSDGNALEPEHLDLQRGAAPSDARMPARSRPEPARFEDPRDERERIQQALARTAGNQTQAALLLGMSRATLVRRLQQYRLPRPRLSISALSQ